MLKKTLLVVVAALLACPAVLHSQVRESASSLGMGHISLGAEYSIINPDYWGTNLHLTGASIFLEDTRQTDHLGAGLSAEYRTMLDPGTDHRREITALIGPRMDYRIGAFYPYFKFSAGLGQFTQNNIAGQAGDHLVMAPSAGIDYRLSRRLSIRALDYESQFWQFGHNGLTPSVISAGLMYRLR